MLITLAAFAVRYIMHPQLQPFVPFLFFFVSCALTEYLVGLGPALLSLVLSFLLGTYYFIMPYGVFDGMISRSDAISTITFVLITLLAIALIEYLQRTLYSRQLLLKISRSHHKISLYRENDRLYLAKKAVMAARPFEKLFHDFHKVLLLQLPGGKVYLQSLFYQLKGKHDEDISWLNLFDMEGQAKLKAELDLLESSEAHQRTLTVHLAEGRAAELLLERIDVGLEKLIAVKLDKLVESVGA